MVKLLLKQTSLEDVTTVVLNIPGRIFHVRTKYMYINVMCTYSKQHVRYISGPGSESRAFPGDKAEREERESEGEMIKLNTIE